MPQLFKRSTSILVQLAIPAVAFLLIISLWYGRMRYLESPATFPVPVGAAPDQEVPFNHEHHISAIALDCRYCHDTVERSAYPGMPASETCMTCHSQIWKNSPVLEPVRESFRSGRPLRWSLLYKLPEFVYFNHSAHVTRGVQCVSCHGQVEKMVYTWKARTFHMRDCLNCHEKAQAPSFIRSRITRCYTCHR